VADVLGLGFEVNLNAFFRRARLLKHICAAQTKSRDDVSTSHGFFVFCISDTRRFVHPHRVRTKKSGLAGCDGWLGVCTKGSSSHVQAVVAG
jgi:hypothetical protein